jgi:uncharacterized protein
VEQDLHLLSFLRLSRLGEGSQVRPAKRHRPRPSDTARSSRSIAPLTNGRVAFRRCPEPTLQSQRIRGIAYGTGRALHADSQSRSCWVGWHRRVWSHSPELRQGAEGGSGNFRRVILTLNIIRVIIPPMTDPASKNCSAFHGLGLLSSGPLRQVALDVKRAVAGGAANPILVFDDATGNVIELDLRGGDAEVVKRLSARPEARKGRYRSTPGDLSDSNEPTFETSGGLRGRGRPKLGVIAREITLLPRQWDWLATHPGGASAVLRRLVDEAKKNGDADLQRRAAQEAAYRFLTAVAGDQPGYEEVIRALFAGDRIAMEQQLDSWPPDIRAYALRLAFRHAS